MTDTPDLIARARYAPNADDHGLAVEIMLDLADALAFATERIRTLERESERRLFLAIDQLKKRRQAEDRIEALEAENKALKVSVKLHQDPKWQDDVHRSEIAMEEAGRLIKEGRIEAVSASYIRYKLGVDPRPEDIAETIDQLGDMVMERLLDDNRAIDPMVSGDSGENPHLRVECYIEVRPPAALTAATEETP